MTEMSYSRFTLSAVQDRPRMDLAAQVFRREGNPGLQPGRGSILTSGATMKRLLGIALFLASSIGLLGCIPSSEQPLSEPASAKPDERLYGVWASVPGQPDPPAFLHVLPASEPESVLDVVCVEHIDPGCSVLRFQVWTTPDGRYSYMSAKEVPFEKTNQASAAEEAQSKDYTILKYEFTQDGELDLYLLPNSEALKAAIKDDRLKGVVRDTYIKLTDTGAHILEFLKAADAELNFGEPWRYTRIHEGRRPAQE